MAVEPAGRIQACGDLSQRDDGRIVMGTGGVLSGIYEWRDGRLVVVQPSDDRMHGLEWQWDGEQFLLVAEPAGTPTGSSYLGASLTRNPPAGPPH